MLWKFCYTFTLGIIIVCIIIIIIVMVTHSNILNIIHNTILYIVPAQREMEQRRNSRNSEIYSQTPQFAAMLLETGDQLQLDHIEGTPYLQPVFSHVVTPYEVVVPMVR